MSKGWRNGSTREWRATRARVLQRDGGRCMLAYPGTWVTRGGQPRHCMVRADCVHHTRGRHRTGDDPDYMVAACTPCNQRAGEPSGIADPAPAPLTSW